MNLATEIRSPPGTSCQRCGQPLPGDDPLRWRVAPGKTRRYSADHQPRSPVREVKRLVRYLAGHTATGTLDVAMLDSSAPAWHVDRTLALVKAYIQLCTVELKMGKTHEEDREDEHLDAQGISEGIEAQLTSSSTKRADPHGVLSSRARGEQAPLLEGEDGLEEQEALAMPAPE